jgi:lipid-A-disaccharide synthase
MLTESSGATFGLVAGEASGDNLGAALIRALAERDDEARFYGVAGPRMKAAGCTAWQSSDELAVMGLAEIVRHLPRLLVLRREIITRMLTARPRAFIGIDAPEFNLRLAGALKREGISTVQYVSPQVWAWRQGRARTIGEAVDLVLCLLPFEADFYSRHSVRAVFVGHPLADRIPLHSDPAPARAALGLPASGTVIAVLPGSRTSEVQRIGPPFAATVKWLSKSRPRLSFVAPMANAATRLAFTAALAEHAAQVPVKLVEGRAQEALAACDAALVASGTATLETALVKRPMVVAYCVAPLTGWLLRRFNLVKTRRFSQPNLLARRDLVPEFFQEQVTSRTLGAALLQQLDRSDRAELDAAFEAMHRELKRNASERAADAIMELVQQRKRR